MYLRQRLARLTASRNVKLKVVIVFICLFLLLKYFPHPCIGLKGLILVAISLELIFFSYLAIGFYSHVNHIGSFQDKGNLWFEII